MWFKRPIKFSSGGVFSLRLKKFLWKIRSVPSIPSGPRPAVERTFRPYSQIRSSRVSGGWRIQLPSSERVMSGPRRIPRLRNHVVGSPECRNCLCSASEWASHEGRKFTTWHKDFSWWKPGACLGWVAQNWPLSFLLLAKHIRGGYRRWIWEVTY